MALLDTIRDFLPSQQNRVGYGVVNPGPKKKTTGPKKPLLSPIFIRVMAGIVILLVLFLICVSLLSSMRQKPITLSEQLVAKITQTITVMDTYNEELHSTATRSLAATLRESLNGTNSALITYLTDNHGYDEKSAEDSEIWATETTAAEELTSELEAARLNGILDRTYAREMILFISEVEGIESEVMERSSNEELDSILSNSMTSLETISNGLSELQAED